MEKITYIIPIHKFDDSIEKYLRKALISLNEMENVNESFLMMVGPSDVLEQCRVLCGDIVSNLEVEYVITDETDIYVKINYAANKCVTGYFSILELDDEFYKYWNTSVQKVLAKERYSIVLPIDELYNTDGKVVGLMNEIAWDAAFTDDFGFLGIEELNAFKDFNVTGGFIKTNDFIAAGGLKPSMKIAAWYEFLLRICDQGGKIYVIPRIGYKHTVSREDSYMVQAYKTISQEEGAWLIEYAKEDYKNKKDSQKYFNTTTD